MQKNKCRTFSLKTLLFNQNLLSVILKIGFFSKGKLIVGRENARPFASVKNILCK